MAQTHPLHFLVIKHGALGDIIQGLDAYAALRQSFPDAHITLLTSRPFAPLMAQMPYFDEIIIDKRAPIWQLSALYFLRNLFQRPFDYIIDLQCSKRTSRYFQWFVKQPIKWVGTAAGCSHPFPDFTGVNNAERMRYAMRMVGAKDMEANLSFLSADTSLAPPQPYAVLMPGCSPAKPSKRWPTAAFQEIAQLLAEEGITPVLIGTESERALCDEIGKAVPQAYNLCNKTSLAELASLCASAAVNLGNDSGPTFLAAKTAAPTLMVMGADTDPTMSAPTGAAARFIKVDKLSALPPETVFQNLKEMWRKA